MIKPTFPDYDNSIVNLACSIQQYYGIQPKHKTIAAVDDILSRNYKHVVVILLDGLGMNIMESHLHRMDFLRRNLLTDYSSVFPPTTTASTTSFLSAKTPIEHGWLGWDVFFEQEDKTVTCFFNTLQNTNKPAANYDIPRKYLPYENIVEQINATGNAKANIIFPFGPEPYPDLNDWANAIRKSCRQKGKTFTYAYWEDPDHQMHRDGPYSRDVHRIVEELNQKMAILCEDLKETVVFITADHGHRRISNVYLEEDYPEVAKMLKRAPSIEPRAISFYVKPRNKKKFPEVFNKYFENDYKLYTKAEVMEMKLFGTGEPHENLTGIGDFIAVATGEKTILWNKKCPAFKSHHAGLSKEEMRIPLIWYENKPRKDGWIAYYIVVAIIIAFLVMFMLR
ncbi:MAG: alkaline phosphatase family protein [Treponema sp.]|nr:alkaline phosphatase family protein [Treponema sp.]